MVDTEASNHIETERFRAAVKIINGLPKDGPFQPSNDLKLRFYAYYKQATVGPCTQSRPAFWDVINRAKWEAWNKLGDISKDEAMRGYIDNIKQIVETMALDDNVQDFISKMGPMFDFVDQNGETTTRAVDLGVPSSDSEPEHIELDVAVGGGLPPITTKHIPNGDIRKANADDSGYHADALDKTSDVQGNVSTATAEPQSDEDIFTDAPEVPQTSAINGHLNADGAAQKRPKQHKRSKEPSGDSSVRFATGIERRRATDSVGSLLRELPVHGDSVDLSIPTDSELDNLYSDSWEALERLKNARHLRQSLDRSDDDLLYFDKFRKHGHKARSSRGREDNARQGQTPANPTQPTDAGAAEGGLLSDQSAGAEGGHSASSETSESSTGSQSPDIGFDPHVAVVMLRMHREIQQVSRQLDLMEGILITQQRLMHATLNQTIQANRSNRLWIFSNLSLRTVLFIVVWPFLVHFIIRLCWRRFIRRRR